MAPNGQMHGRRARDVARHRRDGLARTPIAPAETGGTGNPLPDLEAARSAVRDAGSCLGEAAREQVFVADFPDSDAKGPGGDVVGTVRTVAVIPGGTIVAMVIDLEDGGRTAVPCRAVTVSRAPGQAGMTIPFTLAEMTGDAALAALGEALGL